MTNNDRVLFIRYKSSASDKIGYLSKVVGNDSIKAHFNSLR